MAEHDDRMPGDRRSTCQPVPEKLCEEKHGNLEKLLEQRFIAMDRALVERTKELERRLEGLNELRSEVVRDRDQFVKREAYDMRSIVVDKYVDEIRTSIQGITNRLTIIETRSVIWTSTIGIGFVVLQMILHYWRV